MAEQEQQQPSDFMEALSLLGKRGAALAQSFQLPSHINPWGASLGGPGLRVVMWLPLVLFAAVGLAYFASVWMRKAGSNGRGLPRFRRGSQKSRNV